MVCGISCYKESNLTSICLQDRVNQIQSDLDELVTDLNVNCKQYGLRAKPTSLVELPFGKWKINMHM